MRTALGHCSERNWPLPGEGGVGGTEKWVGQLRGREMGQMAKLCGVLCPGIQFSEAVQVDALLPRGGQQPWLWARLFKASGEAQSETHTGLGILKGCLAQRICLVHPSLSFIFTLDVPWWLFFWGRGRNSTSQAGLRSSPMIRVGLSSACLSPASCCVDMAPSGLGESRGYERSHLPKLIPGRLVGTLTLTAPFQTVRELWGLG